MGRAPRFAYAVRQQMHGGWKLAALFGCTVMIATSCSGSTGGSAREDFTRTPPPTPPDTLVTICRASGAALHRLDDQLTAELDADNLVDQGTVLAMITGVLASDARRIEAASVAPDAGPAGQWVSALDEAVAAGVRAVQASADRNMTGYVSAAQDMAEHRASARIIATELGYPSCSH